MQATAQHVEAELPRADLPLVVGLDGGYVHSSTQRQRTRRDGWFEVIAGKAVPGRSCCFGYVQSYYSKPRRRLFEVLASQGMQPNQQVTFLTDGGDDISRPALPPQSAGRAHAGLVSHHDADRRADPAGQGSALPIQGGPPMPPRNCNG